MTSSLAAGTVTILFTDIEGSASLWEREPDAMRAAQANLFEVATASAWASPLPGRAPGFRRGRSAQAICPLAAR